MLSHEEVLLALGSKVPPEALAESLRSTLRVPEAWQAIHEPEFLEAVLRSNPIPMGPAKLAWKALTLEPGATENDRLTAATEEAARQAFGQALGTHPVLTGLREIAVLSQGLRLCISQEDNVARVAAAAVEAADSWRSPLACALPTLPSPKALVGYLATSRPPVGSRLAVQILLANMTDDPAAAFLVDACPGLPWHMFDAALPDERPFLTALANAQPSPTAQRDERGLTQLVEQQLESAWRSWMSGDPSLAQANFDQAWGAASISLASVADLLAEFEHARGDFSLCVEARRQALQAHPTPTRLAEYAFALLEAGQAPQALAVLTENPSSFEERVCLGLIQQALTAIEAARDLLGACAQEAAGSAAHPHWLSRLGTGLRALQMREDYLFVTKQRALQTPAEVQAQTDLAEALADAGDLDTAVDQAFLAVALDPNFAGARQILAQTLEAAGRVQDAAQHWQMLSDIGQASLERVAEAALAAGNTELASSTAAQLLEADPKSAQALAIMGRALSRTGDLPGADASVSQALETCPRLPEAWIALAELQAAKGDHQSEGLTLATGAQALPDSALLHVAHARWLEGQGRLSEAAEAAERGVGLDPMRLGWPLDLARLYGRLGLPDRAIRTLQAALADRPLHWPYRHALAQIYLDRGDLSAAASLAKKVPPNASPEAWFFAGSVTVRSAMDRQDNQDLELGLALLARAAAAGYGSAELHMHSAQAHEFAGRPHEALAAYQRCLEAVSEDNATVREIATLGLARTALRQNSIALALSCLRLAHDRIPGSAELHTLMAQAHLSLGHHDDAIALAEEAAHLDPLALEPLRVLWQAGVQACDLPLATSTLQHLLNLEPTNPETWLALAQTRIAMADYEAVRSALAHALVSDRRNPGTLQRASSLLLQMDLAASAKRLLQHALAQTTEDPALLAALAEAAEQSGDLKTARNAWSRFLSQQPSDTDALRRAACVVMHDADPAAAIELWNQAIQLGQNDASIQTGLARAHAALGHVQQALNHYTSAIRLDASDVDLKLEAGRAALQAGAPREALEVLARAVPLAPDRWEIFAAIAESLLELERPADAARSLEHALAANAPAQVRALYAIALHEAGRASEALEALTQTKAIGLHTGLDVLWTSRAAAELGLWAEAIQVLEAWLQDHRDPSVTTALISLRLRLHDLAWLYRAADADKHAPDVATGSEMQGSPGLETAICRAPEIDQAALRLRWRVVKDGDPAVLEALRQAVGSDAPGEATEGLVIAYLRRGETEEANRVLSSQPTHSRPALRPVLQGLCFELSGQLNQAFLAYQSARAKASLRPIADYLMGRVLRKQGDLPLASEAICSALAAWPAESKWHFELASIYLRAGKPDAALPHLQDAVALAPDNAQYQLALARGLRSDNQPAEARDAFARVVLLHSDQAEIWLEAGDAALHAGDPQAALEWFEHAAGLSPADARGPAGAARAALALGETRRARALAQTAFRLAPQDPEALVTLGHVLASEGRTDHALKAFKRALRISPHSPSVHVARSRLLVDTGRAVQAAEELREAIKHSPNSETLWAALAQAHEASHSLGQALEASEKASALSPNDHVLRVLLARMSRKLGHLDRALEEASRACEMRPDDAMAALELGLVYEERRESDRALQAYSRAIRLGAKCPDPYFRSAMLLKATKDYHAAAEMLRKASELAPLDPGVLHQLAAVRALELVHGGILQPVVPQ